MKHANIVLTGIMGSGKTTVGKLLSEKLNMAFVDTDELIENKYGKIPELFEKGEEYFRKLEHDVVLEVSEMEGVVIATGGGVVKRKDNVDALKRKGVIFFLDRPLDDILADIKTSNRPLLKSGKERLAEIYNERYHLYKTTCDVHINNSSCPDKAASDIIKIWFELRNG